MEKLTIRTRHYPRNLLDGLVRQIGCGDCLFKGGVH